jgi:uncharacterized protein (DUF924 family)
MTSQPLPSARDVVDFWREGRPRTLVRQERGLRRRLHRALLRPPTRPRRAANSITGWPTAEGTLALLVLLDQFPRNAWRNNPHMLATDGLALAVAKKAVDAGFDQQVEEALRPVLLPALHALRGAGRAGALGGTQCRLDANTQRFAVLHRDIVARFGRFPHRNRLLGRESTVEEQRSFLTKAASRADRLALVRERVHSGRVRLTPGTPLRECPPLRSSFISLRGAPGINRTMGTLLVCADQRLLLTTLASMVCSAQRNKGGAKRGTFAEQSTPSAWATP